MRGHLSETDVCLAAMTDPARGSKEDLAPVAGGSRHDDPAHSGGKSTQYVAPRRARATAGEPALAGRHERRLLPVAGGVFSRINARRFFDRRACAHRVKVYKMKPLAL